MYVHSFRDHHLLQLLEGYFKGSAPLDMAICRYFRDHKALGSKDRYAVAEAAYALIRWRGLLETLLPEGSWLDRLRLYNEGAWKDKGAEGLPPHLAPHIAVSAPEFLYRKLTDCYGVEEARRLCLVSNEVAPTTVRVNRLKCSREQLLERWQGRYNVVATAHSPDGIIFVEKVHFYSMAEFQEGLFELQDEASQLVAQLVGVAPGQLVLDYCAGAGGKALAIAPQLERRGQLFLHDIRGHALQEARRRLRRAGVENAQFLVAGSGALERYKKKMDWVLVDAPCSGTGTLRRNPDMKWRLDKEMVERLIGQQRQIFERALSFLKPGGSIVYATCSIFDEENEKQLVHFQKTYNLQISGQPFKSGLISGGMDGFFGAVLHH